MNKRNLKNIQVLAKPKETKQMMMSLHNQRLIRDQISLKIDAIN